MEKQNLSETHNYHFSSFFVKALRRRYKCKTVSKEKNEKQTKANIYINLAILDKKYQEVLYKIKSPSPELRKYTPRVKNKLPIYTAKTLTELLSNSKLPEISFKKTRLRSRLYFNKNHN